MRHAAPIRRLAARLATVTAGLGLALTALPAAASADTVAPAPPDGQRVVAQAAAKGYQVYDCKAGAWTLRTPAAVLDVRDAAGSRSFGWHYRNDTGPTWQSTDGSGVTGKAVASVPSPEAGAIPWLLLQAVANNGSGVFSAVTYVQRLDTHGGVAPAGACTDGQVAPVAYSARYVFWAPATTG